MDTHDSTRSDALEPHLGVYTYTDDSLERIFARSRSAVRELFSKYSIPPAVARTLLDTGLPTLESSRGTLPGASHRLLETLEAGCRRFRDRNRQLALISSDPSRAQSGDRDYESVFSSTTVALRRRAQRRRQDFAEAEGAASRFAAELAAGLDPVEHCWERERCSAEFASQLLELCRQTWPTDQEKAQQLAKAALTVLGLLSTSEEAGLDRESPGVVQDLTARAWTYTANIYRQRGDLRAADQAFSAASACLNRGSLHPLERAHAQLLESTLRCDQGRYPASLQLLQQAAAIFRWAGDRSGEAGVYQRMAMTQAYANRPGLAIPLAERALKLIERDQEPLTFALVSNSLALLFCDVERFSEARALLPELKELFAAHARSEYDHLALLWLETRILRGEDRTGPAIAILESLRERYLALDRPQDAALVTLELVAEYLLLRQPRQARQLAAQALPVLQSMELERETLAALVALRQATELETATAGWVRGVLDTLRRPRPVASPQASRPS